MNKDTFQNHSMAIIKDYINSSYYDKAENELSTFWDKSTPFRYLFDMMDKSYTLELAAGHGRHVPHYEHECEIIYLMDSSPENIDYMNKRFINCEFNNKIRYICNKKNKYDEVDDNSLTCVFSYDAMVHFECTTVIEYLNESYRVLKNNGMALFHHSNAHFLPGYFYRHKPHSRNFMSAELFAHYALRSGFDIIAQIIIPWGNGKNKYNCLDCLSLIKKV